MIAIPLVATVSCDDKPTKEVIIGDNADYVESAAKGKKPWKSIVVDLTGITTKSQLDPKFQEAIKMIALKEAMGKIVFVKFIEPDGKIWAAKFIVSNEMDNTPMGKEYRKIEKTLKDDKKPSE